MSPDRDRLIDALIAELPGLVFTTGDSVINYLAPSALEKFVRLQALIRAGRNEEADELLKRDLAPTLAKLEDSLGELVGRTASPSKALDSANKVMLLCQEFQELHRPELERAAGQ